MTKYYYVIHNTFVNLYYQTSGDWKASSFDATWFNTKDHALDHHNRLTEDLQRVCRVMPLEVTAKMIKHEKVK